MLFILFFYIYIYRWILFFCLATLSPLVCFSPRLKGLCRRRRSSRYSVMGNHYLSGPTTRWYLCNGRDFEKWLFNNKIKRSKNNSDNLLETRRKLKCILLEMLRVTRSLATLVASPYRKLFLSFVCWSRFKAFTRLLALSSRLPPTTLLALYHVYICTYVTLTVGTFTPVLIARAASVFI